MATLCVNIDHIATLRQARREEEPDPLDAARIVEKAGAIGVTVHLREDRRHIQDRDVRELRRTIKTKLNLEMAATREMMRIALRIRPDQVTLVPEKRRELTTEGGLSVVGLPRKVRTAVEVLQKAGMPVSLFVDPNSAAVKASARLGAQFIEIHTGAYSRAFRLGGNWRRELARIRESVELAHTMGLRVHAGHGLTYRNVGPIAAIPGIEDLNIGHNIVAYAALHGLERAVRDMRRAMTVGKGKGS
jgi:pyridoxine 5-phosphate synthase